MKIQKVVEVVHLRKRLELGEIAQEAEQLHRYARRDDEQAHREDYETSEFLAGSEDLVDEILEHRRCFNEPHYPENLHKTKIIN